MQPTHPLTYAIRILFNHSDLYGIRSVQRNLYAKESVSETKDVHYKNGYVIMSHFIEPE